MHLSLHREITFLRTRVFQNQKFHGGIQTRLEKCIRIEMYSEYYAVFAYIRVFHREASHPSPKLQVAIASFSTGFYFNEVALDVNPGINFEERER